MKRKAALGVVYIRIGVCWNPQVLGFYGLYIFKFIFLAGVVFLSWSWSQSDVKKASLARNSVKTAYVFTLYFSQLKLVSKFGNLNSIKLAPGKDVPWLENKNWKYTKQLFTKEKVSYEYQETETVHWHKTCWFICKLSIEYTDTVHLYALDGA